MLSFENAPFPPGAFPMVEDSTPETAAPSVADAPASAPGPDPGRARRAGARTAAGGPAAHRRVQPRHRRRARADPAFPCRPGLLDGGAARAGTTPTSTTKSSTWRTWCRSSPRTGSSRPTAGTRCSPTCRRSLVAVAMDEIHQRTGKEWLRVIEPAPEPPFVATYNAFMAAAPGRHRLRLPVAFPGLSGWGSASFRRPPACSGRRAWRPRRG